MFFTSKIYCLVLCTVYVSQVVEDVSCVQIKNYAADIGSNITIPCAGKLAISSGGRVQVTNNEVEPEQEDTFMWVFQGKGDRQIGNHTIKNDGSIVIHNLTANDTGNYTCTLDVKGNFTNITEIARLTVRTRPPPLTNLSVHLSTILGLVFWRVAGDGGYPIVYFTAEYRSAEPVNDSLTGDERLEPWRPISPNHITPNARQIDVYHLTPNSSYWFRIWATNLLGSSLPVEALGHTIYSDTNAQLRRHFLTGVEDFDTRVWVIAVGIVMGTLCLLTTGTCLLLYKECKTGNDEDQDVMELVPNIILNPGFVESQTIIGTATCAVVVRTDGKKRQPNGTAQPRKV